METKQFKQGDIIFEEGAIGGALYELKSGTVGLYSAYGTSNEKELTELVAGRIFGEMSVVEAYPPSVTAVALSDVEAEEISTADLQEYFNNHPEKIMEVMSSMSCRLHELTADNGTIDANRDASGQEKGRSSGLRSFFRKVAAFLKESMDLAPTNDYKLHYHRFY